MNKMTFGRWESICLIVNLLCTQIILAFPRFITEQAGTGGWILVIYVSIIAFIGFALIAKAYSPFEGKDLIDIGEVAGGNILRCIVGIAYMIYLLFIGAIVLREFSENMKVITLVTSPISYVTAFFIIGMIIGAYVGLEALVRFSAITMPIIAFFFIIITVGVSPYFDISNLFPVFGDGARQIFVSGASKVSIFSALSILFFIVPFIGGIKHMKQAGYISIGLASLSFLWSVMTYSMVFPYPVTLEFFLPVYQLARLINIGSFFQRIESIFVLIWATSAFIYLSVIFFIVIHIFQKTFRLEHNKPLILPFAVIIFSLSFIPGSLMQAFGLESMYFRDYALITTLIIPLVILVIAGIRKRIKEKRVGEQ